MFPWSYTKPVSGAAANGNRVTTTVQETISVEWKPRAARRTESEAVIEPRLASRYASSCLIVRDCLFNRGQSAASDIPWAAKASAASPIAYVTVTKPWTVAIFRLNSSTLSPTAQSVAQSGHRRICLLNHVVNPIVAATQASPALNASISVQSRRRNFLR